MKIELSVLDQIRVASPCPARWEDMVGDDSTRYCTTCDKHVYRFENMSRPEIVRLLEENNEVCAQLARRRDGTLITNDCPIGQERARKRRRSAVLLALLPFTLAGAAFGAAHAVQKLHAQQIDGSEGRTSLEAVEELWDEALVFVGLRKHVQVRLGGCVAPPLSMKPVPPEQGKLVSPP